MSQRNSRVAGLVIGLLMGSAPAFSFAAADELLPAHASSAVQMRAAAATFLASLSEDQRAEVVFPLKVNARATWSNLPIAMVHPNGLLIADMGEAQRRAFHELLRASTSSQGYGKAAGIMRLDDVLYEVQKTSLESDPERRNDPRAQAMVDTRSSGNYAVAVFGDPGDSAWGWKMTGHHLALNFTVAGGRVGFTPMFLGSNPLTVRQGTYAGWTSLSHEGARGVDFMRSLNDQQRAIATLDDEAARDVFEGPGRRASLAGFEGLKADELSVGQMRLLRALVVEYLGNADFDIRDAQLEVVDRTGWEELWFSWRGPVDLQGEFYYRIHGPRLLIEYNRQNPNHDHAVVRDPENDYGEDWLEHHYRESHPD